MGEVTGPDRLLLDRLIAALKREGEAVALFDEDDAAGIARFRSLGRRAGRELRWKVRPGVAVEGEDHGDRPGRAAGPLRRGLGGCGGGITPAGSADADPDA